MRDSRIGTYGVIGLVGVFSLRVAVLAAEVVFAQVLMLLVLAHGAGRFSSLIALELPPARSEGMGHGMAAQPVSQIRRGAFLMLGLCLVLGPTALAAWFLAALVGLLCHWYWQEWVGGVTGDLAGATAIISEIAIILLVAAWPEAYRCWFWGLVA
jgi:adenosylcobinamide-GDP ribazoletransferase